MVLLALGTLLRHILVNRILGGRAHIDHVHDEKKCPSQSGRSALGDASAEEINLAGLAERGIDADKGNEHLLGMKAVDIPDLRHELRPKGRSCTEHTHDNRILEQRGSQGLHLRAYRSQRDEVCPQLRNGGVNEDPDGLRIG